MLGTNLVEVLQEVDYPALHLALLETGGSGIEPDSLEGGGRGELRGTRNGRAAELEGSRGPGDTRHGGSQGANDGGAEHGGRMEGVEACGRH